MVEDPSLSDRERGPLAEITRRRRGRSWAILVVLLGLCALFYAITIVKMAHP
ncbi:hypothetical protein [Rhodopila sp.]|uniref:hypothetical protein n=1 Tax=Rhodopila sp. TaxID=2480087 RepID=UPI003D144E2E